MRVFDGDMCKAHHIRFVARWRVAKVGVSADNVGRMSLAKDPMVFRSPSGIPRALALILSIVEPSLCWYSGLQPGTGPDVSAGPFWSDPMKFGFLQGRSVAYEVEFELEFEFLGTTHSDTLTHTQQLIHQTSAPPSTSSHAHTHTHQASPCIELTH